jgi:tetratricopeptide (TPR) repeat protein
VLGAFWPFRQAFLAGKNFSKKLQAPVAPVEGRKTEYKAQNLLNNSGVEYSTWLKRGKKYRQRKEYEQAILAFRKAVYLRPADEEARFLLAWCYEKRGLEGLPGDMTNWEALAEQEYLAAIALADHLPARYNLAILYRRQERLDEARKHLEHILLINKPGSLTRKAENELSALFHQSMRPRHIAVDIPEFQYHAE